MKVVLWDWNGTIIDDASILCEVFNAVIEPRGCQPISLERYREIYRHPIKEMYRDAGFDFDRYSFEEVSHEWHDRYLQVLPEVALHHDTMLALESLQKRGSRQMVLSALPQTLLNESIKTRGVDHFFERVHGLSNNAGHGKIDEAISLVETLAVPGRDITVIGDSSHDAEVAREISAQCVLVARGAESRARLEVHGFPVVDSFEGIIRG